MNELPQPSEYANRWILDPDVVFLNHGSFGAAPRAVLEAQARIRESVEREPLQFFDHHYLDELDSARVALAHFIGAQPGDLAFVVNATTGVNTVLRSLRLGPGDELLVTNHEYNACRNALDAVAESTGATVVEAEVPFPLQSGDEAVDAVVRRISDRTRLLLIDHVTSQTGVVLPLKRITDEAISRGAEVLVDGAHAPGMVRLDLESLGATYYTGNCHKWMCAPKGAGFLYVREDRQESVRPLVISHGANAPAGERSRFHLEHDWTGTRDPSAWLAVPSAIRVMGSMLPGGWSELRDRNRNLLLAGRRVVCEMLEIEPPCPESMIGSLASVPLPDGKGEGIHELFPFDALQKELFTECRIEVPVIAWPARPNRLLRISAQLYNTLDQYVYLAQALKKLLT